jgi:dolichol-phosphate mannosyltransferase
MKHQGWFGSRVANMKLAKALTDVGLARLLRRYAQFCVVGGSGMVVDMAILYLLASPAMLGWNLSLSKAIIGWSVVLLNVQVYGLGVNVYLANLIAIVLVSEWNFYLNLRFAWKRAATPRLPNGTRI